jgi:hypothetical protein
VRRAGKRSGDIAALGDHRVGRFRRAHPVEEISIAGKRCRQIPGDLQLPRRANGIPLIRRDDAHEVPLPDHPGTRNVGDGGGVHRHDLGAVRVRTLATWAYHPAVEHARQPHVLHVCVRTSDFVGEIATRNARAHDRVLPDWLLGRTAGERDVEPTVAEEIAVRG